MQENIMFINIILRKYLPKNKKKHTRETKANWYNIDNNNIDNICDYETSGMQSKLNSVLWTN